MSILQPSVRPKVVSDDVQSHPGRKMTEREFLAWIALKTRAEWIDGEVEMMAADSLDHSTYGWWLLALVKEFVERHRLGSAYGPNVLVRLPRRKRIRMPDVVFIASDSSA